MSQTIRAAVIGHGYASQTFHLPLLRATPGIELAALSSREPARAAAALPGLRIEADCQMLLRDPAIDLVVIPTPNATHFPLACAALEHGKHVVVDKPFTLTLAEARQLAALAERCNRVLSVFHNRRWDADFLTLRALIESGRLGRVTHFESHFDRFRPVVRERWREQLAPGGGLWFDLGPHLLDQALQLFGQPEAITLSLANQRDGAQADDWFHAVLDYGPLRAVLHGSALVPAMGPRFAVQGTAAGYLKFGLDTQEDALKRGDLPGAVGWGLDPLPGTLSAWSDGLAFQDLVSNQAGCYQHYYAALRDCILGRAANPVAVNEAVEVMRWIELGQHSAQEGRRMGGGA